MTSLCVSPDGKLLLSAGHVIKMWDLDTKEVYRVSYIPIFLLLVFLIRHLSSNKVTFNGDVLVTLQRGQRAVVTVF